MMWIKHLCIVFIALASGQNSQPWGFNGQSGPNDYDGAIGRAQRQYEANRAAHRYDTQGTFNNPNYGYDNGQQGFSFSDYARMQQRVWNW